jgi:hypothetical protein
MKINSLCMLVPAHDSLIFAQQTGSWQANGAVKSETFLIDGEHHETQLCRG